MQGRAGAGLASPAGTGAGEPRLEWRSDPGLLSASLLSLQTIERLYDHPMLEAELKQAKKTLWRVGFAKMFIARAIKTCDFIIVNIKTTGDPIYYPLVTAIFVLYARPFGDNNGVGMVSSKYANYDSPEKRNLHELLIHGRRKFYAHTDSEKKYYDENNAPVGSLLQLSIVAKDMKDGTIEYTTSVQEPELTLEIVPKIKAICEDLLKTLWAEERELLRRLIEDGCKFEIGSNVMDLE